MFVMQKVDIFHYVCRAMSHFVFISFISFLSDRYVHGQTLCVLSQAVIRIRHARNKGQRSSGPTIPHRILLILTRPSGEVHPDMYPQEFPQRYRTHYSVGTRRVWRLVQEPIWKCQSVYWVSHGINEVLTNLYLLEGELTLKAWCYKIQLNEYCCHRQFTMTLPFSTLSCHF